MKTIIIKVELEESQVECFERILHNCAKVRDDLFLLLGSNRSSPVIQIQTAGSEHQNESRQFSGRSGETATDKYTDLAPEFMLADEAAEYLRTKPRKLALYRKHNLIKYAKFGKNYVYKKTWLDEFSEQWAGYDLSNEKNISYSINMKAWKETHDIGQPKKSKKR